MGLLNVAYLSKARAQTPNLSNGPAWFSRRRFLQLGSVAVVGRPGGVNRAHLGDLVCEYSARRIKLSAKTGGSWFVDTEAFSGDPLLSFRQSHNDWNISLMGARLPGTNLCVDFLAHVCYHDARPFLEISFSQLGLAFGHDLQEWLEGAQISAVLSRSSTSDLFIGGDTEVSLKNVDCACFLPSWAFRLNGLADVRFKSHRIRSSRVVLQLLDAHEPSSFKYTPTKRTHMVLDHLVHASELLEIGSGIHDLALPKDYLKVVSIETSEEIESQMTASLTLVGRAQSAQSSPVLRLGDRARNALALSKLTYTAVLDKKSEERLLVADVPESVLLTADGITISGKNPKKAAGVIVHVSNNQTPILDISIEPASLSISHDDLLINESLLAQAGGPGDTSITPIRVGWQDWQTGELEIIVSDPRFQVCRPDDLLSLTFEFSNCELRGRRIVRKQGPAFMRVIFPPQHLAEKVFRRALSPHDEIPTQPPVPSRAAWPTRLVFAFPDKLHHLSLSTEDLLNWDRFQLVSSSAAPLCDSDAGTPAEPDANQTYIEAPYRLVLSPNSGARWRHPLEAVVQGGAKSELWHTELVQKISASCNSSDGVVRAVWSPDWVKDPRSDIRTACDDVDIGSDQDLFRTSLTAKTRSDIVNLSANGGLGGYKPRPLHIDRLALSSLGAWLDTNNEWSPPPGFSLQNWTHQLRMGRDQYAKVVNRFFLYPCGHAVTLVTEPERLPFPLGAGSSLGMYLQEIQYLEFVRTDMDYTEIGLTGKPVHPTIDWQFSFPQFSSQIPRTPPLDPIRRINIPGLPFCVFWPTVGGEIFLFRVVGTDHAGNPKSFAVPFLAVENIGVPLTPDQQQRLKRVYDTVMQPDGSALSRAIPPTHADFQKQVVTMSKPGTTRADGSTRYTTNLEVERLVLTGTAKGSDAYVAGREAPWFPVIRYAKATNDAIRQMLPEQTAQYSWFVPVDPRRSDPAEKIKTFAKWVPVPSSFTQDGISNAIKRWYSVPSAQPYLDAFAVAGFLPPEAATVKLADLQDVVVMPLSIAFNNVADRTSGLGLPNLTVVALSELQGPLSSAVLQSVDNVKAFNQQVETLRRDVLDASTFFPEDATLLGGIKLSDLMQVAKTLRGAPKIISDTLAGFKEDLQQPRSITAELVYETDLVSRPKSN